MTTPADVIAFAHNELGYVEQGGPDGHSGNVTKSSLRVGVCRRCGETRELAPKANICRPCSVAKTMEWRAANPEKFRAQQLRIQERNRNDPEAKRRRRHWRMVRDRGLTHDEYDAMLAAQGGRCAGCRKPVEAPDIDHDHHTGKIRGLLCRRCNLAVGLLDDDPDTAAALAAYLESHS